VLIGGTRLLACVPPTVGSAFQSETRGTGVMNRRILGYHLRAGIILATAILATSKYSERTGVYHTTGCRCMILIGGVSVTGSRYEKFEKGLNPAANRCA
jgi:hypothetical protein